MATQKFIRFDWALKKLLRNKANFDILEGFLSELLREDVRIQQILESESNKEDNYDKYNRVNLLVENAKKELIIIEVQNSTEYDYFQRLLYGTSKKISEHMYKGMLYSEIKKLISITIAYFDIGQGNDYVYHGTTNFVGIHNKDVLELNAKQVKLYGDINIYNIFPEYYLIKVNKFDELSQDSLDEWIYFLKNEDIPKNFHSKGIDKAREEFAVVKMSKEEKAKYDQYLDSLIYESSMFDSTFKSGKIEGREEGREEERAKAEKEKIQMAKMMKDKKYSVKDISEITGMLIKEIEKL